MKNRNPGLAYEGMNVGCLIQAIIVLAALILLSALGLWHLVELITGLL